MNVQKGKASPAVNLTVGDIGLSLMGTGDRKCGSQAVFVALGPMVIDKV